MEGVLPTAGPEESPLPAAILLSTASLQTLIFFPLVCLKKGLFDLLMMPLSQVSLDDTVSSEQTLPA